MSERIELANGQQIRGWATKNGFDVVNLDPEAPRFFDARFTPTPGAVQLFSVEHSYLTADGKPMITLKRVVRAATAEDALYLYFREPKERSAGDEEYRVGFAVHSKPVATDREMMVVAKLPTA